jgi:hypothetical protein
MSRRSPARFWEVVRAYRCKAGEPFAHFEAAFPGMLPTQGFRLGEAHRARGVAATLAESIELTRTHHMLTTRIQGALQSRDSTATA